MQFDWETFTYDEEWLREAVRQEEEAGCDVVAGNDWGLNLSNVMASPEGYSQFTTLRSMVTQAWRHLVAEWDLGIGREAAEAKGQELIFERLRAPHPAVRERLMTLLEAKLSKPQGDWEMAEAVHAEIRAVLSQVLTQEDWNSIAASAGDRIRHQVLAQDLVTVASHR